PRHLIAEWKTDENAERGDKHDEEQRFHGPMFLFDVRSFCAKAGTLKNGCRGNCMKMFWVSVVASAPSRPDTV
ncbi:MAG: hypothetical protein PHS17_17030, partial [Desulfobacterales bacterium]|nr:hypothetical protein [Desulfobacterales bacterium]